MTLAWSHDPDQRPEAEHIALLSRYPPPRPPQLTQIVEEEPKPTKKRSPYFIPLKSPSEPPGGKPSHPQQSQLPAVVESGFSRIHTVRRVDCVETVTCATAGETLKLPKMLTGPGTVP